MYLVDANPAGRSLVEAAVDPRRVLEVRGSVHPVTE